MSGPEETQAYTRGYEVGYQHGLEAARKANGVTGSYAVTVVAQYPESSSRVLMFFRIFKTVLLIPHMIVMWFLGIAAWFVMVVCWWAVVLTGQFPRSLFDFLVGVQRWQIRLSSYYLGLSDQYPPFSFE